jgi:hypothetical protein
MFEFESSPPPLNKYINPASAANPTKVSTTDVKTTIGVLDFCGGG